MFPIPYPYIWGYTIYQDLVVTLASVVYGFFGAGTYRHYEYIFNSEPYTVNEYLFSSYCERLSSRYVARLTHFMSRIIFK